MDKINLRKMRTTTKKIVLYLEKKGKMSASDICNDTGVDGLDIEIAQLDDRAIQEVLSPFGASSFPWFAARKRATRSLTNQRRQDNADKSGG